MKGKKIIAVITLLCFLLSFMPIAAFAADEVIASGNCGANGDNVTWELTSDGVLTISGSGEMKGYNIAITHDDAWIFDSGDRPWEDYRAEIKEVVIQNGVTSIGLGAFAGFSNLTTVSIASGVQRIEPYAFTICEQLRTVDIPDSVTILEQSTFCGCVNLENVSLSNNLREIAESMFYDCNNLTEIILPDSIIHIGASAFRGCTNLTEIIIPNGVTAIEDLAFYSCKNLSKVTIPYGVTKIGNAAFAYCNFNQILLPETVSEIGAGAFSACNSLESIKIPEGVTAIKNSTFEGCENLKEVFIPKSVQHIYDYSFGVCWRIKDVYYTGTEKEWNNIIMDEWGTGYLLSANLHFAIDPEESSVSFNNINTSVQMNEPVNIQFNFDQPTVTTTAYVWFTNADSNIATDRVIAQDNTINETNNDGVFVIENAVTEKAYTFSFPRAGKYTVKAALNNPLELLENGTVDSLTEAFVTVENILSRPVDNQDILTVVTPTSNLEDWVVNIIVDGKVLSNTDAVNVKKNNKKGTDVTIQLLNEDGKPVKGYTLRFETNSAAITVDKETVTTNAKGEATFNVTGTVNGYFKIYFDFGNDYLFIPVEVVNNSTGSSSGGSSGGGSSSSNSSNISNITVTTPDTEIKIDKSAVGSDLIKDAEAAVAEDDTVQVVGGKNGAVSISGKEHGNTVAGFEDPVTVTIPVSDSMLNTVNDTDHLTLAKVTKDENGEVVFTYMGGNYNPDTKTFTAYIDEPGDYILLEDSNVQKIELQIGNTASAINGTAITNDVAPIIYNGRTMVPLRFLAETLGAQVDWNEATRTVTLTIDGVCMSMTIDKTIEGFDTAPIIYKERTMVPIRYIAEKLNANVIYVPDTQEIVVVK